MKLNGSVYLSVFFSILVLSCFMWSGAQGIHDLLLPYHIISIASHMTNMLISTNISQSREERPPSSGRADVVVEGPESGD